jgi:hypothetical protein
MQNIPAEAEARQDIRTEILNEHVGPIDKPQQEFAPARAVQICRDAAFAAVVRAELRTQQVFAEAAERIAAVGLFYLYDVRAHLREKLPRIGTTDEVTDLNDSDAMQKSVHVGNSRADRWEGLDRQAVAA